MSRRAVVAVIAFSLVFLPGALAGSGAASQLNGTVRALAWQSGYLYAGGDFTNAGGVAAADHVARWDGSWSAVCGGLGSDVRALGTGPVLVPKNGGRRRPTNVYAGGFFSNAGGIAAADRIARCNGTAWSALGNTQGTGSVLAILRVGLSLYAGGDFQNFAGVADADYVAKWTGTSWQGVGGGVNGIVNALAWRSGSLYVGGEFTNAGGIVAADKIARWDGSAWTALGTGIAGVNGVHALAFRGSDLYVGGTFLNAGGIAAADRVAKWDGSGWSALGTGVNAAVYALAARGSTVYVGGEFTNVGGIAAADTLAAWDAPSADWSEVCEGGLNDASDEVYALLPRGSNDLYVGGRFSNAGGVVAADNIALCNGVAWAAL